MRRILRLCNFSYEAQIAQNIGQTVQRFSNKEAIEVIGCDLPGVVIKSISGLIDLHDENSFKNSTAEILKQFPKVSDCEMSCISILLTFFANNFSAVKCSIRYSIIYQMLNLSSLATWSLFMVGWMIASELFCDFFPFTMNEFKICIPLRCST